MVFYFRFKNKYVIAKEKLVAIYNRALRAAYSSIKIMTCDETIDYILMHKCSLSRFGDGELFIMRMKHGIGFQEVDEQLATDLKKVINSKLDGLLICFPRWLFKEESRAERTDRSQMWCNQYIDRYFYLWVKYISLEYIYGETSFNRRYISMRDKATAKNYFLKLKKIWDNRDCCFVEGEKSMLGVGNDLFDNAKSIQRIIAPSENAYKSKSAIIDCIINEIPKDHLILCALGPTATVLCFELTQKGYQSVDIGHVDLEYEWMIMGAEDPVPVRNKYVNECGSNPNLDCYKNKSYEHQIIRKLNVQ